MKLPNYVTEGACIKDILEALDRDIGILRGGNSPSYLERQKADGMETARWFIWHCMDYLCDVVFPNNRAYSFLTHDTLLNHPVYSTNKSLKEKRSGKRCQGHKFFSLKFLHELGKDGIKDPKLKGCILGHCYEFALIYDRLVPGHKDQCWYFYGPVKNGFVTEEDVEDDFKSNLKKRLY